MPHKIQHKPALTGRVPLAKAGIVDAVIPARIPAAASPLAEVDERGAHPDPLPGRAVRA
jgi:hypothetical protein